MKFGRNLHRYQIVEWTPFYIDYKVLKRLYKDATKATVERGEDPDFTRTGLPLPML
jgi:SPX domain protein involved in polyphosphate accumulation